MNKFIDAISSVIVWLEQHALIGGIVGLVGASLIAFIFTTIILKIVKAIFKKRKQKTGDNITLRYVENIIRGIFIIVAIYWVLSGNHLTASFGDIIFKGSAVVGAIIGFAAQPVISDLIGGLLLSISKPFQIGDRIEVEDYAAGIVKDITFRHVVLLELDKREIIIPNSRLSAARIINTTRVSGQNSFVQRIGIAYGSNVREAMTVLEDLVQASEYTIPGKPSPDGEELIYPPAYFLEYGDSALILAITVYYPFGVSTEIVRTDINLRIDEEFKKHNIEIPFNYVNVVVKNPDEQGA